MNDDMRVARRNPAALSPHPLNDEIYGDRADAELVESIRDNGVLNPLLLAADGKTIVSGHRRWAAAQAIGLQTITVIINPRLQDDLDIAQALIEANRQRAKTNEQIGREYKHLARILNERQSRQGNRTDLTSVAIATEVGSPTAKAAEIIGVHKNTANRAARVVEAIDSAEPEQAAELRSALGKSVNKAYRMIRPTPKTQPRAAVNPPPRKNPSGVSYERFDDGWGSGADDFADAIDYDLADAIEYDEDEQGASIDRLAPSPAPQHNGHTNGYSRAHEPQRHAVHFSSKSAEHYTPAAILDAAVTCLGAIDLDPCSNSHKTPNVPASRHYTREDDGLAMPWQGRVYMNPPYGRELEAWIEKLVSEYDTGNISEAIALVPARTDTQWWQRLARFPLCLVIGRLTFLGNNASAPFPSALFYLGDDIGRFYAAFSAHGDIWQRVQPDPTGAFPPPYFAD
ncbi:MAG: ParB N-terminal domain-containing protein [Anaerolineae bacterium]|nr:ParB N-terminal domain-containing protein [Anaerolineae bacterium]